VAERRTPGLRIGLGVDRHPFDAGRPLLLGGVTIPGGPGLAGHSDADAVLHAVADALAGAAGLPDIGTRFPAGDPRWRGVASRVFLEAVRRDLEAADCAVVNVDLVILAEVPPLAPHLEAIRTSIAALLRLSIDRVGAKAKRGEGLGFVGERAGIEVQAVALVERAPAPRRARRPARRAAGRRR
jgi:2-C-methyl-D-erythritol 2,4-cyclodiphosphate synthase